MVKVPNLRKLIRLIGWMEIRPLTQRVHADHCSTVYTSYVFSHFLSHSLHTRGNLSRSTDLQSRMSFGYGGGILVETHTVTGWKCRLYTDSMRKYQSWLIWYSSQSDSDCNVFVVLTNLHVTISLLKNMSVRFSNSPGELLCLFYDSSQGVWFPQFCVPNANIVEILAFCHLQQEQNIQLKHSFPNKAFKHHFRHCYRSTKSKIWFIIFNCVTIDLL